MKDARENMHGFDQTQSAGRENEPSKKNNTQHPSAGEGEYIDFEEIKNG